MSSARRPAVAVACVVVALFASGCGLRGGQSAPRVASAATAEPTFLYVIPPGTGDRIDRGEPVDILPATLTAQVGDVLRIVNEDDRGHLVGPFFVAAGQTLSQRFESPGELVGACSVHEDGEFTIDVVP